MYFTLVDELLAQPVDQDRHDMAPDLYRDEIHFGPVGFAMQARAAADMILAKLGIAPKSCGQSSRAGS
jgi:hypothetical protein